MPSRVTHPQFGGRRTAGLARRALHVGLLAPPWIPVPPPAYGGIEQVVALLARELAGAGHTVTLVAAPGSAVDGVRVLSPLSATPDQIGQMHDEWVHCLSAIEALADVDVIVDHSGPLGAMLAARSGIPALHVLHGPLGGQISAMYAGLARHTPSLGLVAISEAQRRSAPDLPIIGVCHNGIEVDEVPFHADHEGYLVFLGRMSPDKGVAEAIALARAAGRPLLIAAKCREPEEQAYFERFVAPEIGPDVQWLGEIGPDAKYDLLGGAQALVFPISWEEPFGLVMVEAMACGTPVLATARGSVPEVVVDGVTGFVRNDHRALAACVERLDEIDRRRCRAHVIERFSAAAMTNAYERVIHDAVPHDAHGATAGWRHRAGIAGLHPHVRGAERGVDVPIVAPGRVPGGGVPLFAAAGDPPQSLSDA